MCIRDRLRFIQEFRSSSVGGTRGFRIDEVSFVPATGVEGPLVSGRIEGGPGNRTVRIEASQDLGRTSPWHEVTSILLNREGSAAFSQVQDNRPGYESVSSYFLRATVVE